MRKKDKKLINKLIDSYKKIRKVWKFPPYTRIKPAKKKRRRDKQKNKDELDKWRDR